MFNDKIICSYLYIITKYGYPPEAQLTPLYMEEMANLGFTSIELEGIREEHLLQVYDLKETINITRKKFNLNVPYFCAVLPGLTSADSKERQRQLDLFKKGCEIAELLGSLGILDNAPLPPYVFPDDIPIVRHYGEDVLNKAKLPEGLSWKTFWDYTVSIYREACDIAADHHLTYQMHPSVGVLASNTDDYLRFHESVKRDNLRFNLDTANQFLMKDDPANSLRRLSGYIDYIHLSDNRGEKVEHLSPGNGNINWNIFFEILEMVNFKGHIGLDIGGDESDITDIDKEYVSSAVWLEQKLQSLYSGT